MNTRRLALATLFAVLAFMTYMLFYDTLIPGLPQGSYRLANPFGFTIATFWLTAGQIIIAGFILHLMVGAIDRKKEDYLRALFIVSLMTLLFSFTYVIFPRVGPFFYIVYSVGMAPWYAVPFEILWTSFVVVVSAALIHKEYKISMNYATLFSLIIYLGITAAAS